MQLRTNVSLGMFARTALLMAGLLGLGLVKVNGHDEPVPKDFDTHVTNWKEITLLPNVKNGWPTAKKEPFFSLHWLVEVQNGEIIASASDSPDGDDTTVLPFVPSIPGSAVAINAQDRLAVPMADGWIVATDFGEWGGKVAWFSHDGSKRIDISDDQLSTLIRTGDGLFGLGKPASLGADTVEAAGADYSLIAITQQPDRTWRTKALSMWPGAAIASLGDHRFLLTSGAKVFTYELGGSVNELPKDVLPPELHVQGPPASCHKRWVFLGDKVYFGVQHYVTELNLRTGAIRYLIPDDRFVNDTIQWEVSMNQKYRDREMAAAPVNTGTMLAAKELKAKKLATYEKLEAEFDAQLATARPAIERCFQQHGPSSMNPQNHDPFFKLIMASTGRVKQIVVFDGASPAFQACILEIFRHFQCSPFPYDKTLTINVHDFRCTVGERSALFGDAQMIE